MRRRTRGSRFTWMPMLGTVFSGGGEGTYQTAFARAYVQPNQDLGVPPTLDHGSGVGSAFITALVPDYTEQPDPAQGTAFTLRDYTEGQDWFLRRIVGKLTVGCATLNNTLNQKEVWPAVLVTAGFFVARSQDVSEGQVDLATNEWDPQDLRNIRQPWIWRRTWVLGAAQVAVPTGNPTDPQLSALWPNTNESFGSMADGPHVDAKTLRRIRREERLWMALSVLGLGEAGTTTVSSASTQQPLVQIYYDLRALGAMRKAKNASRF